MGGVICGDCERDMPGDAFMTETNPEGGYGAGQVLVCDDCMRSGRWDAWKAEHWPNWPERRIDDGQAEAAPKT